MAYHTSLVNAPLAWEVVFLQNALGNAGVHLDNAISRHCDHGLKYGLKSADAGFWDCVQ
jgi:hypothetical protein